MAGADKISNRSEENAWYEACMECADHLDLEWTDDHLERKAGNVLSAKLRKMAFKCPRK